MKASEKRAIEELALLLDGDVPADEVPAGVRQLASLATAVRDEIEVPGPRPEFKAALRTELLEAVAAPDVSFTDRVRDAVWERTARWRHSARVLVASATASSMIGTAGVAVAAQQALPGELLYPVKQITEDVRMGLASGLQETGRLHLQFATERLEELTLGVESYDADTVIDLLTEMDEETLAGTEDLLRAYEQTGNELILVVLERFAEQQRERLSAIFDQLPSEAIPFVDRSFEILRRIEVTVAAITHGCQRCGTDASGTGSLRVYAPGEGPVFGEDACDCVTFLPSTLARDAAAGIEGTLEELSADGTSDNGGSSDGSGVDDSVNVAIPTLPEPLEGAARSLESAIGTLTGTETTTTDTVTNTVDDTTTTVTDTTDSTTDTVTDTTDSTTDTVTDTTDSTVDGTTGTVEETTTETTGTVDELLDSTEDTTLP